MVYGVLGALGGPEVECPVRVYLVQHGKAVDKKTDPERPLSPEGAAEVEAVAAFLAAKPLDVAEVWHSGKTRARQTAEGFGPCLVEGYALKQRDGLAPKDTVGAIARELDGLDGDVMIVGHLPFLDKLASLLVASDEDAGVAAFRNAGVVCLVGDKEQGWQVEWSVIPEIV
ncbi:MAG: phosphohistidine phosphatase SixA [Nitrospiraceae bacterium]|nr:phosphohistidine phosphatase SixA [Nitrospiraceae bacterium]